MVRPESPETGLTAERRETLLGAVLIALACVSFYIRLRFVMSEPYPASWDSFFYLEGLRQFLSTNMHVYWLHATFFSFWGTFGQLLGLTDVQTYRVAMLFSFFMVGVALAAIAWALRFGVYALALPVMVWSMNLFFNAAYISLSEMFGFAIFCTGLFFFVWEPHAKLRIAARVTGNFLFAFAAFTHIFSAVLVTSLYVPTAHFRRERMHPVEKIIFAVALIFCFTHFVENPKPFFSYLTDFGSIHFEMKRWYFEAYQYREFIFSTIVIFVAAFFLVKNGDRSWLTWMLFAIYLALISPLWITYLKKADHSGSFTDRLPQTAPLVWLVFMAVAFHKTKLKSVRKALFLFSALFLFAQWFYSRGNERKLGPPMSVGLLADNRDLLKTWIPEDAYVRAMHGVQFRVTYFLGNESTRRPSASPEYFHLKIGIEPQCVEIGTLTPETIKDVNCVHLGEGWVIRREKTERGA